MAEISGPLSSEADGFQKEGIMLESKPWKSSKSINVVGKDPDSCDPKGSAIRQPTEILGISTLQMTDL